MSASRLVKFVGELIAATALIVGWVLGVSWLCGDRDPYNNPLVSLVGAGGMVLAAIFETVTLQSVTAGLIAWTVWFAGASIYFRDAAAENPMGWLLAAVVLPAVGVLFGVVSGKRRARTAQ
jgi:hypothetical protein